MDAKEIKSLAIELYELQKHIIELYEEMKHLRVKELTKKRELYKAILKISGEPMVLEHQGQKLLIWLDRKELEANIKTIKDLKQS